MRSIAQRFRISATAAYRHKAHIPKALAQAVEVRDAPRSDDLLGRLRDLQDRAERVLGAASCVLPCMRFCLINRTCPSLTTPGDLLVPQVELIAPHLRSRKRITQDGRVLRRYRRRWRVERLFAWLQNFRRLITRHERHAENFLAFLQLGCVCILLRHF